MQTVLRTNVDYSLRYDLENYTKGEMFPAVSDTMFDCMFNNSKRKKYVANLITFFLKDNLNYKDLDPKTVLNNLTLEKEKLDRDTKFNSRKTVDLVCKLDGEIWNLEMNNNPDIPSLERNIYYASTLYGSLMKSGVADIYSKTIQLNINNFNFSFKRICRNSII